MISQQLFTIDVVSRFVTGVFLTGENPYRDLHLEVTVVDIQEDSG